LRGDPLSPFLFLLVVEGFSRLMVRAREMGEFKGIEMGHDHIEISHFRFAVDTIVFCEASDNNICSRKSIFDSFKLASRLKVNYYKSLLFGFNVSSSWLNMQPSIWVANLVHLHLLTLVCPWGVITDESLPGMQWSIERGLDLHLGVVDLSLLMVA
jgi:hypothetical protein